MAYPKDTRPNRVVSAREGKDGKTHWQDIGVCWEGEGNKYLQKIRLNALPLPDAMGEVVLLVFPPREDDPPRRNQPRYVEDKAAAAGPADAQPLGDPDAPF